MRIPIPSRKSRLQRFLDKVNDSLDVPSGIKSSLPSVKSSLPSVASGNARKAGLIAGTLAGLTAGSAGISSLRRRNEGARDDS
ncbi:MAG: hypothetical protein ACR2L9_05565 [Solirubrobacteraceae bacterium]